MLPERKKIIDSIIENNKVRLRESYFINNHSEVYSTVISFCLDMPDLKFVQKIWHWVSDKSDYFCCECGKRTNFHKNWNEGYRLSCSPKCAQIRVETKEKRKRTSKEKWGVENVSQAEFSKKKQEETNLKKWGYKSSSQNESVKEKYKKTVQEKWGKSHYFQTEEFKSKAKQYYLKKYGVEHQSLVDEIQNKIKETCFYKYGVRTYLNTKHSRDSIVKYNKSSHEIEIKEWLSEYVKDIQTNSKLILPLTLDLYLPEYKTAIEFNGLYWHSEIFKKKNYHNDKSLSCKEKGVDLLHIWEDDWKNRKDIVKSIILNKLNLTPNKIWARKCKIIKLNNQEVSDFLNANHIQGYSRFRVALGLIYKDELVSVMTFGNRAINGKISHELLRFANKKLHNVVGGASKLFKNYTESFEIEDISSFSDKAIFGGEMYKKLGFKFIHRSPLNYWWVVKGIRYHRFTFNKKKLVKKGYANHMTEVEIMHSLGNYRIWGCGQDKWVWKNV